MTTEAFRPRQSSPATAAFGQRAIKAERASASANFRISSPITPNTSMALPLIPATLRATVPRCLTLSISKAKFRRRWRVFADRQRCSCSLRFGSMCNVVSFDRGCSAYAADGIGSRVLQDRQPHRAGVFREENLRGCREQFRTQAHSVHQTFISDDFDGATFGGRLGQDRGRGACTSFPPTAYSKPQSTCAYADVSNPYMKALTVTLRSVRHPPVNPQP